MENLTVFTILVTNCDFFFISATNARVYSGESSGDYQFRRLYSLPYEGWHEQPARPNGDTDAVVGLEKSIPSLLT